MISIQKSKNNISQATKFHPILWVHPDKYIDAVSHDCYLGEYINDIRSFQEITSYEATKARHYIFDTDVAEETLKAIVFKLGTDNVSIYKCESKLPLSSLTPDYDTAIEMSYAITHQSKDASDWLKEVNSESNQLSYEDAIIQAKLAIKLLKGSAKTTELAILRKRCNERDYAWGKAMKELESEFREELERRKIVNKGENKNLSRHERLKLELASLSQETDFLKKEDKVTELSINYGIKEQRIWQLLDEYNASTVKPKARRLKASELHAIKVENNNWLFPSLIPSTGVTLLAANPGVGKTTLAYDCAASIIYNQEFLGEKPLKTGKVLFVNSLGEMNDSEIISSFVDRGIGITDKYEIVLDWDLSQLPILQEAIEEIQPTLIVIDSFRGITNYLPNFDENSSKAGLPIQQLQSLCNHYKTAMLLIHHNSKSKDYASIAKSSGNFSIAASCSAVLQIDKNQIDKTLTLSTAKIRGSEEREIKMTLDGFNRHFKAESDTYKQDEQETKSIKEKVLELLNRNPSEEILIKQLPDLIGENYSSVNKTINRLHKQGIIIKLLSSNNNQDKVIKLFSTPPSPNIVSESVASTPQTYTQQENITYGQLVDSTENLATTYGQDKTENTCPEAENTTTHEVQTYGQIEDNNKGGGVKNECPQDSTDKSKAQIRRGDRFKYVGEDSIYKDTEITSFAFTDRNWVFRVYFKNQDKTSYGKFELTDLERIE